MNYLTKRLIQVVSSLFILLAFLLLCQIDSIVLQCTDAFFPGYGAWVCTVLVVTEILAAFWVYKALFGRPSRLVLRIDATDEERELFCHEMRKRLATNPHVLAAGLSPDDPGFLAKAMQELDRLAELEIRSHGKKVFLGTALSQNGRLDALIMFFSLCRMVWRISAIYNQKPTPEEIWSVASTVSSSTFVAFSIEALDIPQTITETMNNLVPSVAPAMAASSVPFVGAAVHVFTASLIDGAANCLLAVRAGVLTRRAYSYAMFGGKESLRRSCIRETGSIMLDISHESVGAFVTALKRELQELSLDGGKKLVSSAGKVAGDLGTAAVTRVREGATLCGEGVQKAATAVKETAQDTVEGVRAIAEESVNIVSSGGRQAVTNLQEQAVRLSETTQRVGENAQKVVSRSRSIVQDTAEGVRDIAQESRRLVMEGASQMRDHAQEKLQKLEGVGRDTVQYLAEKKRDAASSVQKGLARVRGFFSRSGKD